LKANFLYINAHTTFALEHTIKLLTNTHGNPLRYMNLTRYGPLFNTAPKHVINLTSAQQN